MATKKYICESKYFTYYSVNDETILMKRKKDKKMFYVSEINDNELHNDIENDEIIKISPDFIYDYTEIKKEIEQANKIEFINHFS